MTAFRTLALALALAGMGFIVGYGYQARGAHPSSSDATPAPTPQAPLVKGLHSSPDGKLLAFTGVYARSERAGVWILNPTTGQVNTRESPVGWQDYVTQWGSKGQSLLLEREKIPHPVEDAKAGLFSAPIDPKASTVGELQPVADGVAPQGEKITTGLLAPDGQLIIKTRSEPKALFLVKDGDATLLDRAGLSYGQNRLVREGKNLVVYVVRDIPGNSAAVALYRVVNGKAQQLSPAWYDVAWSYVAPSGKQIIVARQAENGTDWNWTLCAITETGIKTIKTATIPADVISVYWSLDEKRVLGAAGDKLWITDVPDLKTTQLGSRTNWGADDATWIGNQNSVAIAADGEIWKVDVPSGKATKLWRFPDQYWN